MKLFTNPTLKILIYDILELPKYEIILNETTIINSNIKIKKDKDFASLLVDDKPKFQICLTPPNKKPLDTRYKHSNVDVSDLSLDCCSTNFIPHEIDQNKLLEIHKKIEKDREDHKKRVKDKPDDSLESRFDLFGLTGMYYPPTYDTPYLNTYENETREIFSFYLNHIKESAMNTGEGLFIFNEKFWSDTILEYSKKPSKKEKKEYLIKQILELEKMNEEIMRKEDFLISCA